MKRTRITAENIRQLVDMRNYGLTWRECGFLLVMNPKSLRAAMSRVDAKCEWFDRTMAAPENVLAARAMRASGMRWKQIGATLGVEWRNLYTRVYAEDRSKKHERKR